MQKQCPVCQTPASLAASACTNCGHQYRTQFVPPVMPAQTQILPTVPPNPHLMRPSVRQRYVSRHLIIIIILISSGAGGLLWYSSIRNNGLVGRWQEQNAYRRGDIYTFTDHIMSASSDVFPSQQESMEYHVDGGKLLVQPPHHIDPDWPDTEVAQWPYSVSTDGQMLTLRPCDRETLYLHRIP